MLHIEKANIAEAISHPPGAHFIGLNRIENARRRILFSLKCLEIIFLSIEYSIAPKMAFRLKSADLLAIYHCGVEQFTPIALPGLFVAISQDPPFLLFLLYCYLNVDLSPLPALRFDAHRSAFQELSDLLDDFCTNPIVFGVRRQPDFDG